MANNTLNKSENLPGQEVISFLLQIIGVNIEGLVAQSMEKKVLKVANDKSRDKKFTNVDNVKDISLNQEDIEKLVYLIDKDIQLENPKHIPEKLEEVKQIATEITEGVKQEKGNNQVNILEQIRCKVQGHITDGKGSRLNRFAHNIKQSIDPNIKQNKIQQNLEKDQQSWERSKV